MEKFINLQLDEIEKQIIKIERDEKNEITKSTQILTFFESKLEDLKSFIIQYDFKTEVEEILFFKEIKPKIISKLIYYISVYKIEMNRPKGSCSTVETYLLNELDRLKHYFERNIEMYHYYRTGCTHFDKIYFLRNRDSDIPVNIACFYFERDVRFSTGYDYKIAKIMANDLLELYIKSQLVKLKEDTVTEHEIHTMFKTRETWTASKTDLAELIYALDTSKCINHGNIKLKALTSYLEDVFNVSIGDIYRIYLEIRDRKGSRTQFLDCLKDNLTERMIEADSDNKKK
ncbi:MAG: RteC domain-containing protein [Bacteroidales bacterium]|nr:RteC domain-containing protein [Bacteroidales bacterium]